MENVTNENKELIDELYLCAAQSDTCYKECLSEENHKMLRRCMDLTQECYEACTLAGKALEKNTEFTGAYLKLCADICVACAEECQKHDHEHCQMCANECLKCANMCMDHSAAKQA